MPDHVLPAVEDDSREGERDTRGRGLGGCRAWLLPAVSYAVHPTFAGTRPETSGQSTHGMAVPKGAMVPQTLPVLRILCSASSSQTVCRRKLVKSEQAVVWCARTNIGWGLMNEYWLRSHWAASVWDLTWWDVCQALYL